MSPQHSPPRRSRRIRQALRQIFLRHLLARLLRLGLWFIALSLVLTLLLRWLPVPLTGLMVERKLDAWLQGRQLVLQHEWQPWEQLPDSLKMAVIAGEDQKFAVHHGFDLDAIAAAFEHNAQGGRLRGGSTISQQVAKNLFLWSGRSWLRKGLEAWFTLLIETLWPKQRILEVYLNSVEWGDGIFGAEAAARQHFRRSAPYLSETQSSQLAAVLPAPLRWSAANPPAQVQRRAAWIRVQMRQLGGHRYLERLQ
jgi:monofunctional biosynthetic peptidoglycan transglycosylase